MTEVVPWTGCRVRMRQGWARDAFDPPDLMPVGTALGEPVFVEQKWLPLKWDDREDPDFFKLSGLERIPGAV